jgi:hypothetical protein
MVEEIKRTEFVVILVSQSTIATVTSTVDSELGVTEVDSYNYGKRA